MWPVCVGLSVGETVWLVCVAALWGATNPLIKEGGRGIETIKKDGAVWQFLAEIKFLFLNWKVSRYTIMYSPVSVRNI